MGATPIRMNEIEGTLPGIDRPLEHVWKCVGVLRVESSLPHRCAADIPAQYVPGSERAPTAPMPFAEITLRCAIFRKAVFSDGRVWHDYKAFVGQCPRCGAIYWADVYGGK